MRVMAPRPLPLHLARAMTVWTSSLAALPSLSAGSLPWSPALAARGQSLASDLASVRPEELTGAIAGEARRRGGAMMAGIEAYQSHPYQRSLRDPPVVWRHGASRLLDYGARRRDKDRAVPVLFVPSLVNRSYILDLSKRRSLMRWLASNGLRPLLMDWGSPGDDERGFDLDAYITQRLEPALDAARQLTGGPVTVAGYCMGGLLALALALRRPQGVQALALLATPWEFHGTGDAHSHLLSAMGPSLDGLLSLFGELPIDVLQALFTWSDPSMVSNKFRAFAAMDSHSQRAEEFVALEDWLNDGVALTAGVARDCLTGWYGENRPARGQWTVAGTVIEPGKLAVPSLVALPRRDRIVAPASAAALADALDASGGKCHRLTPPSGHIGMVVGGAARKTLWQPLADWLRHAGQ
ncbi:MAG: alpha/beta fold hydrolase [Alphaproteobacteria bacterium]